MSRRRRTTCFQVCARRERTRRVGCPTRERTRDRTDPSRSTQLWKAVRVGISIGSVFGSRVARGDVVTAKTPGGHHLGGWHGRLMALEYDRFLAFWRYEIQSFPRDLLDPSGRLERFDLEPVDDG